MTSREGMADVAVLGAAGFVGANVCRVFHERGHQVAAVDVRPRPSGPSPFRWWAEANLLDPAHLNGVLARLRPRLVVNAAGYGVARGQDDAQRLFDLNTLLPVRVAEAMADARVPEARLLHVGSGAEYGDAGGHLPEDGPATPVTPYGASKLAGTNALLSRAAELDVDALVVRPFTLYGPGESPGRLVPTLLAARTTTGPIPLSAGTQERDFVHVDDLAEALTRLAAVPRGPERVVNVATGELVRVRDFVTDAAHVLGLDPARLAFGALPPGKFDVRHDPVDVSRLVALTGWRPSIEHRAGVLRTLRRIG